MKAKNSEQTNKKTMLQNNSVGSKSAQTTTN